MTKRSLKNQVSESQAVFSLSKKISIYNSFMLGEKNLAEFKTWLALILDFNFKSVLMKNEKEIMIEIQE